MITTIDAYVAAVRRALGPGSHAEELAELRSQLTELAAVQGEAAACRSLGDPEAYAAALRGDSSGGGGRRVFGIPFTYTEDPRVGLKRMFDPTNPKVIVPKVMGYGWTINWGAVAVKLHLLRPDDIDDDVLAHLRLRHLAFAAIIPLALAAVAVSVCVWGIRQGGVFPTHWGNDGVRYAPALAAFGPLLGVEAVFGAATVAAVLVGVVKRWVLLALGALGVGTWITGFLGTFVLMEAARTVHGWWVLAGMLVTLALAALVTFVPLKLALRTTWAEQRSGLIREARR